MTRDHNKVMLSARQKRIKRGLDILLTSLLCFLCLPLLALIALAIKVSTPGPILYKERRVGHDGEEFHIYKFRTMYSSAEKEQILPQAAREDPRLTHVGRLLRRSGLHEIPQLLNVLRGEMSLVGPRAMLPFSYEKFREAYEGLEGVKPGITGWAQIAGWQGEARELSTIEANVRYDRYYIEHWSVLLDLKIILLTGVNGFRNYNAY